MTSAKKPLPWGSLLWERICFYRSTGLHLLFPKSKFSYWQKYVHLVLVNHLGLSLPRNSVIRSADHPNVTIAAYCGRKATTQQKSTGANSFLYGSTHMKKDSKNDRVAYFESVSFQLMLR